MKKFFTVSAALIASFFIVLPLFAEFNDGSETRSQVEGFNGEYGKTVTVAEALRMRDDEYVVLVGSIVKKIRPEHYLFQDKTGSVTIEIDKKRWNGLSVGPSDRVELIGKIDRDPFSIEVDVKRIKKLN